MYELGECVMPENFRYKETCLKGRPRHERLDAFSLKHPQMPISKRAKIFAPFDALKGYSEAVASKRVLYEEKRVPACEDMDELNHRLHILHGLTYNSRMARANRPEVTVTYYEPCSDVNSEAYGSLGRYKTVSGICLNVDAEVTKTILVDSLRIPLEAVRKIEGPGDLFERDWSDDMDCMTE